MLFFDDSVGHSGLKGSINSIEFKLDTIRFQYTIRYLF
jgi:hypothetical protein